MVSRTKLALLLTALLGLVTLLFLYESSSPAQQNLPLQITSPTEGTTVAPGQTITVVVSAASGVNFAQVVIIGEDPLGSSDVKTSPPFTFSMTIPPDTSPGRKRIRALGVIAPGEGSESPFVTLNVEDTRSVTDLSVEPTEIKFKFAGEQLPLRVVALLGASSVDVTRSSQTSYNSNDNAVARVDTTGLVTAVSPGPFGATAIVVRYRGRQAIVSVSVPKTVQGDLDGDGDVDQDDLNVILDDLNTAATGPFDARDLNHDGRIDNTDVEILRTLCSRPNCSTRSNRPPDTTQAKPSITTLWPPNHVMAGVSILGVTDPDGDPVTTRIDRIRQDEPTSGLGDGDTWPDGQGVGTPIAQLRMERSGTGNGRVYTIFFTALDGRGGSSSESVKVSVPHDRSDVAVDDGPVFDSTVCRP